MGWTGDLLNVLSTCLPACFRGAPSRWGHFPQARPLWTPPSPRPSSAGWGQEPVLLLLGGDRGTYPKMGDHRRLS
jgi:hypothetical protein